jgi:two-component system chemotaxis response regulator CheV
VLILDLEHIIGEIFPETVINYDEDSIKQKTKALDRGQVKIFFAEDSAVIRTQVSKILRSVGYGEVVTFDNGLAAFEALSEVAEQMGKQGGPLRDHVTVLLSDIEMPQMDGLTLCRRVKQELKLPLPVIMFSSLINEQMARKCKQVGADGFASKPETERLIEIIDSLG